MGFNSGFKGLNFLFVGGRKKSGLFIGSNPSIRADVSLKLFWKRRKHCA